MYNQLKTVLLLGLLSVLLVVLGGALGRGTLYLFAGLAILMNVGAYFYSDKLVLRMHRAREVGPEEAPGLHRLLAELANAAGLPKPRLALIESPQPNAFATGRDPAHGVVAVTRGIVGTLSERELRGVLAHELAHIRNRDILLSTVAAVIATAITYIAHAIQWTAIFGGLRGDDDDGGGVVGTLALAFVAPIAAMLIQLGVSRSREYLADETGARISGDPDALADALLRLERAAQAAPAAVEPATASLFIVNPLGPGVRMGRLFSTHPPVEERVARLRALSLRGATGGFAVQR